MTIELSENDLRKIITALDGQRKGWAKSPDDLQVYKEYLELIERLGGLKLSGYQG